MTTLIATANTFGLTGLASWFKKLDAKLTHQSKVRATIKQLSALSDAELRDIGITRGDIYTIAHGTADIKAVRENVNLAGWV